MLELLTRLDTEAFLLVNRSAAHPALDPFFLAITDGRTWVGPVLLAVAFAFLRVELRPLSVGLRAEWRRILVVIALAALAFALTDLLSARVLKPLIGRPRPCDPSVLVQGGRFLLGEKTSPSLPSNHAANAFAVATVLAWVSARRLGVLLAVAALIALSRVYVGVHYPLDVLAGALLGAAVGTGVYWASTPFEPGPPID